MLASVREFGFWLGFGSCRVLFECLFVPPKHAIGLEPGIVLGRLFFLLGDCIAQLADPLQDLERARLGLRVPCSILPGVHMSLQQLMLGAG